MSPFSPLLLCPPFGGGQAIPLDLAQAVADRLAAALVPGQATWAGVDQAPVGTALPYVEVRPDDDDTDFDWDAAWPDGTPYDLRGTLPVHCYGTSRAAAHQLRQAVKAAIRSAPLASQAGVPTYVRASGLGHPGLDEDPAPGGGDCWQAILMVEFIISSIDT